MSLSAYLDAHAERHVSELAALVSFPSISTLAEHRGDIQACAEWLAAHLETIGFENTGLHAIDGMHPVVYADWMHAGPDAPTVLVYGHYDVQPVDPLELWLSPPFEPEVRDGKLYGRGVSDNKGQLFANVKALEALLAVEGRLPCNVKVLFEGEEELRADHLDLLVAREQELFGADLCVVSDVSIYSAGVPGLALGLRGMAAVELTVRTADGDLHSGLYGGAVPNALHVMSRLLASLHDPVTGRVAVDGFYDRVETVPDTERRIWCSLPFDESDFLEELGVKAPVGEEGYSTLERLWCRPTIDVHGAWGGFAQEEGFKTIVPAVARAKLSCRLVPAMQPRETIDLVVRHLEAHTPPSATLAIDWTLEGSWPVVTPHDHPAVRAAVFALTEGFGLEPVLFRSGWSVPAAEILQRNLGLDLLLLGFALPDENAHAPNEHYDLANYAAGIRTMTAFWPRFAAQVA
jgi:acetylornithine deacetylase/succinyl-diaminopimelate desuccinylase-like protein